jgi:thymidine kinase
MSETAKIIVTFLCSSAFIGFIQFLIQRYDNRDEKYKAMNSKIEDGLKEREIASKQRYEEHAQSIEELRNVMKQLAENSLEQKKIINANTELLLGLAQDRLVFLTDKYIARGNITLDELAVVEQIYEPYHNKLGGNGRGKAGVEKCRELEIDGNNNAQYSK